VNSLARNRESTTTKAVSFSGAPTSLDVFRHIEANTGKRAQRARALRRRMGDALEERRMKAAKLLREGLPEAEVARRVGAHRQSVNRWARDLKESGVRGLKKAGRAGRKPKLGPQDLRRIEHGLKRGPEALGYEAGLWTTGRVGELIFLETGVRFSNSHVWNILRCLGWSCQSACGASVGARRERHPALEEGALAAA
jgi:transposase